MHVKRSGPWRAGRWLCMVAATGALGARPAGAERSAVTRAQVLATIRQRLRFVPELTDVTEDEKQQLVAALELDALAVEILPASIPVRSEADAKVILDGIQPTVKTRDATYNRLAMKKLLMDIRIDAQMNTALPVLSTEERKQLVAEAAALTHGAEQSMRKHLGEVIAEREILGSVERLHEELVRQIDYPKTYAMKQVLGAEAVERLLKVFDGRLARTAHRASERLARLPVEPGDEAARARRAAETRRILMEVLRPLRREILTRTSPDRLRKMDADDILPGYAKVVQELHSLEFQLARRAAARQRKGAEPAGRPEPSPRADARPTARQHVYDDRLVEEALRGLDTAPRPSSSTRTVGPETRAPVASQSGQEIPAAGAPRPGRSALGGPWARAGVVALGGLVIGVLVIGALAARRRTARRQ